MDFVVFGDIGLDGALKVDDGVKDAAFEPSLGQGCKEAFDRIEPAGGRWGIVEGPAWVAGAPCLHLWMLVGGIVIDNVVNVPVGGHLAIHSLAVTTNLAGNRTDTQPLLFQILDQDDLPQSLHLPAPVALRSGHQQMCSAPGPVPNLRGSELALPLPTGENSNGGFGEFTSKGHILFPLPPTESNKHS